jgi:hypothetical protein
MAVEAVAKRLFLLDEIESLTENEQDYSNTE